MAARPKMIAGVGQDLTLTCTLSGADFESATLVNLDLKVINTDTDPGTVVMTYVGSFLFIGICEAMKRVFHALLLYRILKCEGECSFLSLRDMQVLNTLIISLDKRSNLGGGC